MREWDKWDAHRGDNAGMVFQEFLGTEGEATALAKEHANRLKTSVVLYRTHYWTRDLEGERIVEPDVPV